MEGAICPIIEHPDRCHAEPVSSEPLEKAYSHIAMVREALKRKKKNADC